MFNKKPEPPPIIVKEVASKLTEFNAMPTKISIMDQLREDQAKDRQEIVVIQRRMAERRGQIAFLEDNPGAEATFHALLRFLDAKST
jgi:hypothetical protein